MGSGRIELGDGEVKSKGFLWKEGVVKKQSGIKEGSGRTVPGNNVEGDRKTSVCYRAVPRGTV